MNALSTVQLLLDALAYTVATGALEEHLDLYSRHVQVFGVPGREFLDHRDVSSRRRTEFKKGLLLRLSFKKTEVLSSDESSITYQVQEVMRANRQALVLDKRVTILHEFDGKWRVREEHILHAEVVQKPSLHHDE